MKKFIIIILTLLLTGCSQNNYYVLREQQDKIAQRETVYVAEDDIKSIKKGILKVYLSKILRLKLKLFEAYKIDLLKIYRKLDIKRKVINKHKIFIQYSFINYKNKQESECFVVDDDLNKRIVLDYKVSCF